MGQFHKDAFSKMQSRCPSHLSGRPRSIHFLEHIANTARAFTQESLIQWAIFFASAKCYLVNSEMF